MESISNIQIEMTFFLFNFLSQMHVRAEQLQDLDLQHQLRDQILLFQRINVLQHMQLIIV